MSAWHPFILVMQAAENRAYRVAHRVISMLPAAEAHMRQHGLAPGKFVYVPNGIDPVEWERSRDALPSPVRSALGAFRQRHPFLVGYAGAHGLANALDALVEAAAMLEPGSGVVLVGQGPEKARLEALASGRRLGNVLFLPPVAKGAVPALLAEFDALYIGLQRQPLFRFGVSPNKLIDYMMAGKPVIHAIEAGNDLVAEAGCGLSVTPEEPAAVAGAARSLRAMSAEARSELGLRGRRHVLQNHAYPVLARRFLDALQG